MINSPIENSPFAPLPSQSRVMAVPAEGPEAPPLESKPTAGRDLLQLPEAGTQSDMGESLLSSLVAKVSAPFAGDDGLLSLLEGPSESAASSARTPATARQEAEALWADTTEWKSDFRRIEKDFLDVNAPVSDQKRQAAEAQLAANAGLEKGALDKLSPEDRAAYDQVSKQTRNDAPARLALQVLLIEGKLKGTPAADGQDLLAQLSRLSTAPLHPKIDRQVLVSDLIQELAAPSSINQMNRQSCMFSSIQIQLASQQPAEYVREVAGLASPKGQVTLPNGQQMTRNRGTEQEDGSKRSISTRLWVPAVEDFGARSATRGQLGYDNKKDPILGTSALVGVMEALGTTENLITDFNPMNRDVDEIVRSMEKQTQQGTPVEAGLVWGEGSGTNRNDATHAVLVTKFKDDRVYYSNPWGTEESMSREDFKARLASSVTPALRLDGRPSAPSK